MLESNKNIFIDEDNQPSFTFNRNLREVPENVRVWINYLKRLKEKLVAAQTDEQRLMLFERIGYTARVLMRLDEAEDYLLKAISLSFFHSEKTKIVQNLIRLAHVYQWKNNFAKAHLLFDQAKLAIEHCEFADGLRASYYQHLGKTYFDQGFYRLAQYQFELALKIRLSTKADNSLVASTEHCLDVLYKLNKDNDDSDVILRRAENFDAEELNKIHIKSINEFCEQNYPANEIADNSRRKCAILDRQECINSHFYVVAERDGRIEGFCLVTKNFNKLNSAHIFALYLSPAVKGQNVGKRIMNLVSEYCNFAEIDTMTLVSSAAAFNFYKKHGFIPDGDMSGIEVNGVTINGYPMRKSIN